MMEREERLQKKGDGSPANRQAAAVASRRRGGEKGPLLQRIRRYFHEVRVELKKVSWPTNEQMKNFTTVTLVTSVALTLVVFALDFGLKELVLRLLGGFVDG